MDVTIANLNISVHWAANHKRPEWTISRGEQEARRAQLIRCVEQERQQTLTWYTLHGGH